MHDYGGLWLVQAINLVQKALPTIQSALPIAQKGIRAGGGALRSGIRAAGGALRSSTRWVGSKGSAAKSWAGRQAGRAKDTASRLKNKITGEGSSVNKSFDPKGLYSPKIADNIHKYTYTPAGHKNGAHLYQDSQLLVKELVSQAPNTIPRHPHLLEWTVRGSQWSASWAGDKLPSQGYWNLVVDPVAQEIVHFVWSSGF